MSKEKNNDFVELLPIEAIIQNTINLSVEEYTRLKDIETRFAIIKEQMLHAEYCPIHTQIILGIEKEYEKQKNAPDFMEKSFNIPSIPPLLKGGSAKDKKELNAALFPKK